MGSIPPRGSIPPKVNTSRPIKQSHKVKVPPYKKMGTDLLENLLHDAQDLEDQLLKVIKFDPDDENLDRFNELQGIVAQLKQQIQNRR